MSTTFNEFGSAASTQFSFSQWMKQVRLPLAAWSGRRRWAVALLIAALVFALGTHGWALVDPGGIEASRTALNAAARHLAESRHALAQLPALRRQAAARPGGLLPASWSSADDVRIVSELATQNSVSLLSVEPGASSGSGVEGMRPIQITAHTDFVHLMAFLRGLSDLPVLIVPVDVTVNREAASLALKATLQVFSALKPVPSTTAADAFADDGLDLDDEEDIVFFDPFLLPQMLASGESPPDVSQLRLVGLLRDRTRGLALLDTPNGATTLMAGQRLGTERVTAFDALGITLANGGGATRTLALTEAS
jgi:Tfp pilus assembly protein PilO